MPKRKHKVKSLNSIIMTTKGVWYMGELVWAKYNNLWWPGVILGESELQNSENTNYVVFWLGENTMSNINTTRLIYFFGNFKDMILNTENRLPKWRESVCASIKILYKKDCEWKEIEQFAKTGLPTCENIYSIKLPEWMKDIICFGEGNKLLSASAFKQIYSKRTFSPTTKKLVKLKIKNKEAPHEFCLACYQKHSLVAEHPIFEGKLCKECLKNVKNRIFIKGNDGAYYYCSICGLPGEVMVCDNPVCHRVYCKTCIKDLAHPEAWSTFIDIDAWLCFLCNKVTFILNGLLKPREDYSSRILEMFKYNGPQLVTFPTIQKKTKLRVLSLFDGISTGYVALKTLGIGIDEYYASEIDPNSIKVSKYNFPSKILYLGDITLLTEDVLRQISPIHLVIGGSPCNDLSLVNPTRKGLYDVRGTGKLFFEFYRVINLLKKYNSGFFWIYENVASMPAVYKNEISKYLKCYPMLHDAVVVSPQHRSRLFWGNIPNLQVALTPKSVTLQECLTPNRTALVTKINTVTTRPGSLLQGVHAEHPVLDENNKLDLLWVTELEKIFGLPEHYTDAGFLSVGQRQKLLGKAWSVPVITHLLSFLKLNQNICQT